MILAAGRGERMRPLTDRVPKPLLRLGGRCLIEHHLVALAGADIREVVINVAYRAEEIVTALGDGSDYGLRIEYSHETPGALDTGGGVRNALPLLGRAPFAVINADTYTDYPYTDLRRALSETQMDASLVLVPNPPHHPDGDFGLRGDRVVDSPPRHTFAGIGVYRPDLFERREETRFGLATVIRDAVAAGRARAELYRGRWFDVGRPATFEQLGGELG